MVRLRKARLVLAVAALLAVLTGACGGALAGGGVPTGRLRLRCRPADAVVYLDEEYRGACRLFQTRAVPVGEGTHRLQVEATGYFPYYGELDTAGTTQTLEVELVPRPD
ncbi:MAG: PEGA domain-containing protein [Deltaproteobacteria bacterium]|nr:PEGA domain-containing protein [Deltaproteobacteria bacterium]